MTELLSFALFAFLFSSTDSYFALADASQNSHNLRGGSSESVLPHVESSCHTFKSQETCHGKKDQQGQACVWCTCSAIPSECVTEQQSRLLPSAVFDCEPPSTSFWKEHSGEEETLDSSAFVTSDASSTYLFIPGVTHTLTEDDVDPSLCDPNSKSLAGYISIDKSRYDSKGENKHLFYWFFEKRNMQHKQDTNAHDGRNKDEEKDIPFIVWLTGGPGCSSSLALLTENGPCSVSSDGLSTIRNPYSWTETAHVLWLDQPAGVGYSYGDMNDSNEEMISEDAYYFLQAFFQKHAEYSNNPLFIVGESYGGHYAPAIAHKIWTKNQQSAIHSKDLLHLNLKGLAVGNGLTNPIEQYKWYPEMVYKNSHHMQVVSEDTYNAMKSALDKCIPLIEKCNSGESVVDNFACQAAFVVCNAAETAPYQMTGLNPYDMRKKCGDYSLCYDFSNIETFLNLDSTKKALHISKESHHWETCNMVINLKFHTDWMKDFSPYVRDLLNDGIPALIYAGDVDFICNYLGNRAWTLNLDWNHSQDFQKADEHEWGDGAGLARTSHGLTFLQVYDAGHMVPTDQPMVALKMIQNFIHGGSF